MGLRERGMAPMIRPALTLEEWEHADKLCFQGGEPHLAIRDIPRGVTDPDIPVGSHALAALCLYGEPFGFTREDVRILRAAACIDDMVGLADRIEALLPPEES